MNPGDIVVLKSGGPKMTIVSNCRNGEFVCYWFSGDSLQQNSIPECALKKIEPDELNQEN